MKTTIKLMLGAMVAVSSLAGCVKEEAYDLAVIRNIDYKLNGVDGKAAYGQEDGRETERYLYFFQPDGNLYAYYGCSHNITLPNGDYKLVAIHDTLYSIIKYNVNLNDAVYDQRVQAQIGQRDFRCSTPQDYTAGNDISIESKSRTGVVRIAAADTQGDRSYAKIRTTFSTDVYGWHIGQGKPVTSSKPFTITKTKETAGGIGFSEEVRLVDTQSVNSDVKVTIEYLDKNDNVLRTREIKAADGLALAEDSPKRIQARPNQTCNIKFMLNDPTEEISVSYDLNVGEEWETVNAFPAVKAEVPEGYTYVGPGESVDNVVKEQLADDAISEIKVYLKAGESYKMTDAVTGKITKPIIFLGQNPAYGQAKAALTVGSFIMKGDLSEMVFKNLQLASSTRFINLPATGDMHLGKLEFDNCEFNGFKGTIYHEAAVATANVHKVDHVIMNNVKFTNMTAATNGLFNISDKALQAFPKWDITNCVFQGKMNSVKNVIVKGLKQQTELEMNIENCTFLADATGTYTYFLIEAPTAKVNVKNCLIGGKAKGGTWFSLQSGATVTSSGNTFTKGFEMVSFGIDGVTESAKTYDDALNALK